MVPTRTIGVVLEALQSGDRIELLAGADSGPVIERFMNRPSVLSRRYGVAWRCHFDLVRGIADGRTPESGAHRE